MCSSGVLVDIGCGLGSSHDVAMELVNASHVSLTNYYILAGVGVECLVHDLV